MDKPKWTDIAKPGATFLLGLLTGAAVVAIATLMVYIGLGLPARGPRIEDVRTETLPPGSIATSKLERIQGGRFGGRRLVLGIPRGEACPACLSTKRDGQSDEESFHPASVTSDGEKVWVGVREGSVVRIDPSNGRVVQEVELAHSGENAVTDMVVAGQDIWALAGGQAYRVDTRINGTTQADPINLTVHGTQIAFDGEDIWAAARDQALVVRIDAGNGKILKRVELTKTGGGVTDMAVGDRRIWVLVDEQIYQVDASNSEAITLPITTAISPTSIAYDGDSLWVGNTGKVVKFQPDNRSLSTISLPDPKAQVQDLAWDGTYVWVLDAEGFLTRIRAGDSTVDTQPFNCEKVSVDQDSRIFYEASYIWVTLSDGVLYRG